MIFQWSIRGVVEVWRERTKARIRRGEEEDGMFAIKETANCYAMLWLVMLGEALDSR